MDRSPRLPSPLLAVEEAAAAEEEPCLQKDPASLLLLSLAVSRSEAAAEAEEVSEHAYC